MKNIKKKAVSFLLIFSLFFGIIGIINLTPTYAESNKLHLKKNAVSVKAGKTYQQKLIDKNGKTIKVTKVKWRSSKPSIAKIDKKGKIKAVKKGAVKMTAKYKGKVYKFTVKVTNSSAKKSASATDSSGGTVYWTPSGSVYHTSEDCPTLSRSKTIYSGTIKQSGKSRCCKVCG